MPVSVRLETLKIKPELASKLAQTWHYSRSSIDDSKGQTVPDHMEVVVIENERLTVTVAPMLGGRIVEFVDRISGAQLFDVRNFHEGSSIGFRWNGADGFMESQPVAFQLREADEPDEPGGVVLFGILDDSNHSWQATISLEPGSAAVDIRFQATVRDYVGSQSPTGLALASQSPVSNQRNVFHFVDSRTAVCFESDPGELEYAGNNEHGWTLFRNTADEPFGPRQLDSWSARPSMFGDLSGISACNSQAAIYVGSDAIELAVSQPILGGKLVLALESGESVEAPIQAYSERTTLLLIEGMGSIQGAALLDGGGNIVIRWDRDPEPRTSDKWVPARFVLGPFANAVVIFQSGEDPTRWLNHASKCTGLKQASFELQGDFAMTQNDFAKAIDHYDRALAYGAEDAILWWKKAYAMRKAGLETEERDELANAHFLSPLEPLLRAEAFLSQPVSSERAPNPLVAPLAMFPDQMTLVANHLLELGQNHDAARWIDECLRHREIPMLRILWAAMLLANGAKAEAYAQAKLGSEGVSGQMESRRWKESAALDALCKAFPDLPNLDRQAGND